MAEQFDPYRMWLGIPPEEQPPHVYRLLGIGLFESDLDVIEEAADRQMAHVQRHKLGQYAALSQKLLNELSSAKLCLLKPDRKALYDRQLRAKLAAQSRSPENVPPVVAPSSAMPVEVEPLSGLADPEERLRRRSPGQTALAPIADHAAMPTDIPQTRAPRTRRSKQKPIRLPIAVVGGVIAAILIGMGLMLASSKKSDEPDSSEIAHNNRGERRHDSDTPLPAADSPDVEQSANAASPSPPESEPVESNTPDAREMTEPPKSSSSGASPSEPSPAEMVVKPPGVAPVKQPTEPAPQPVPAPPSANFDLAGHTSHITCIAVNPADANQVVSGSFEAFPANPLRAWDLAGRRESQGTIRNYDHEPNSICFSQDGRWMVHAAQNLAHLQQVGTDIAGHYTGVTTSVSLVKTADGRLIVAGGGKFGGGVWDPSDVESQGRGRELFHFGGQAPVNAVLLAPDAMRVYAGFGGQWKSPGHEYLPGTDFNLHFLDLQTQQSLDVPGHGGTIWGIAMSRDGTKGATASEDRTLRVWDLRTLKSLHTLSGHDGPVYAVAMSPDGKFVLSGGADKTVRLWDAKVGRELRKFAGHTDIVRAVALTVDGKYALSGGNDKLLRVWDLQGALSLPKNSADRPPVAGGKAPAARNRVAVPGGVEIEASTKLIREVFADDFKRAKKPPDKLALAEKLLQQVAESQSDSERYSLFSEARSLAGSGGSPALALQTIEQLGEWFDVDVAKETVAYLEPFLKERDAFPGTARKELAAALLPLADVAIARNDYENARRLMILASSSARKTNDGALTRQIAARLAEINDAKKLFDAYQKAEAKLAANADDAEAQLAAGKYLCFVKQDWTKGLAHLAQGNDVALRETAEADLKSPTAPEEQVKLGDLWWALSEQAKGKEKFDYTERCDKWYSAALPGLKGLVQTKVTKRLEEIAKLRPATPRATQANSATPDATDPAAGEPLVAKFGPKIKKAIATGALVRGEFFGARDGANFADVPPAGLILAGFRLTFDDSARALTSITPIYWTTRGTQKGTTFGDTTRGRAVELLAKPGYGLAGLRLVRFNTTVDTFQVLFAKLGPNGFESQDTYLSARIGLADIEYLAMPVKRNVSVGIYGIVSDGIPCALGVVQTPEN